MQRTAANTLALCLLLTALTAPAQSDFALQLQPPEGDYRRPMEPIRIRFPSGFDAGALDTVSVELDAIDITAVATYRDGLLEFVPIQPLEYGEHELRVVQYHDDGSIEEIGWWQLEVRQSALYREASFAGQFDLAATQRVAEDNLPEPPPDEFQVQGSAAMQAGLLGEGWQTDARMDLFYLNNESLTPNERNADMGSFLVATQAGRYDVKVGHHHVAQRSLVMDGFNRRGVSATVGLSEIDSTTTGFVFRTDQIVGFEQGLGVTEAENRVSGVTWDSRVLDGENAQVIASASYFYGKGSQGGVATVGQEGIVEQINEGDGWSAAADGSFFREQLRVRAELAHTGYDFDGSNFGFDPEEDEARSLLAVYTPSPSPEAAVPATWSVGAETLKVGTFFRSLANATLASDKDLTRLFGSFYRGQWSLEGSLAREENNLDDNPLLATTETGQWYLSGGYGAAEPYDPEGWFGWLGTPAYSLLVSQAALEDIDTPVGLIPNDSESAEYQLNAVFSYTTWNWSLGYSYGEFTDYSDQQIDSETQSLLWNASFSIGGKVQLTPGVQFDQTLNKDFGTLSENTLYSLGTAFVLWSDTLTGNLSYNMNRSEALTDPYFRTDQQSSYLTAELLWHLRKPERNKVGYDLSLSFSSQDATDRLVPVNSADQYQAFVNLRMTLPAEYPGGNQ